MSEAFCQSCGASLDPGAKFCKSCGSPVPVTNNYAGQAAPPPQPAYPVPPVPPHAYHQPAGNGYTHYTQPEAYGSGGNAPLSVGQYLGMMLLTSLPLVGFILLLIWAFSSDTNANKKNYARAVLIIALIGIVLSILFGAALAGMISELFYEFS